MSTTRRTIHFTALVLAAAGVAACTDFATPAELSHPQILAVRAEPPAVAAGERARLTVLVAGPAGRVEPSAVRWRGSVEIDGDEAWYVAPPTVDAPEGTDSVEVTVELDDGSELSAVKIIPVGIANAANPTIQEVRANEAPLAPDAPLVLAANATVLLDLDVSPAPGPDAIVSWYTTAGEIELYRRTPTDLVAPAEPAAGALFAVYRDGLGGVAWRELPLRVE